MAHLVAAVPAASREAFAPIIISGDAHPACSKTTDAKTSGHPFATTIQPVLFLHVRRSTSIKGCTDSGLHLINFNIIAKPISGLHAFLSAWMHVSSGTGMCAGVLEGVETESLLFLELLHLLLESSAICALLEKALAAPQQGAHQAAPPEEQQAAGPLVAGDGLAG